MQTKWKKEKFSFFHVIIDTNATSSGFPCITNKDLKTGNCKKYFGLKKKKMSLKTQAFIKCCPWNTAMQK